MWDKRENGGQRWQSQRTNVEAFSKFSVVGAENQGQGFYVVCWQLLRLAFAVVFLAAFTRPCSEQEGLSHRLSKTPQRTSRSGLKCSYSYFCFKGIDIGIDWYLTELFPLWFKTSGLLIELEFLDGWMLHDGLFLQFQTELFVLDCILWGTALSGFPLTSYSCSVFNSW